MFSHLQLNNPVIRVADVEALISSWPKESEKLARVLIKRHGNPHEAMPSMLLWHYTEPWLRTIVHRDGVHHNFPKAHLDLLEQVISYQVPVDRIVEIAKYDGSVSINQTAGEVTVRCEDESMNFVTANLMHLIAINQIDATTARRRHLQIVMGMRIGWQDEMCLGLQFTIANPYIPQFDPDRRSVTRRARVNN